MPQSTLSASRVLELLDPVPSREELTELLFASKAELSAWESDDLLIEATADRLDLLSEGGLGLYLAGVRGQATGLPVGVGATVPDSGVQIDVEPAVSAIRPEIGGLVVEAPSGEPGLQIGLLAEAIRFQELLHATVGRDRRAASLGIYPLARLDPPIRYACRRLDEIRFVPLEATEELDGRRFFAEHPMAAAYGALGRVDDRALVLEDRRGTVLSLPPVLNGRSAGEARVGDRRLLLESTGTRAGRVEESLGLLAVPFVARGWTASAVAVRRPSGEDDGHRLLEARTVELGRGLLDAIAGRTIPAAEVTELLGRCRLGVRPRPDGWSVRVPPWRPDLLAGVDVVEDVLLARGIRPGEWRVPPSFTRGRRQPESRFRSRTAELLLGLGFVPVYHPVLVGRIAAARLGRTDAVALANPVSELFSVLRDSLLVSLLDALERNRRYAYPQRISEVGPVLLVDGAAESGARTVHHAGVVVAADTAGFAEVAALADYLLRSFGAEGVREPAELPGTIRGRGARLRVAGEVVAELGEVAPSVLVEIGLSVPVAYAEIDLSALWPLVAARGTD